MRFGFSYRVCLHVKPLSIVRYWLRVRVMLKLPCTCVLKPQTCTASSEVLKVPLPVAIKSYKPLPLSILQQHTFAFSILDWITHLGFCTFRLSDTPEAFQWITYFGFCTFPHSTLHSLHMGSHTSGSGFCVSDSPSPSPWARRPNTSCGGRTGRRRELQP